MKNLQNYKLLIISGSLIASQAIFSAPAQALSVADMLDALKKLVNQEQQQNLDNLAEKCKSKPGGCTKNEVPEPMTILGIGAALASLPAFKKHYGKAKKEDIS